MEEGEIDEKDTTIDYEQVCRHPRAGPLSRSLPLRATPPTQPRPSRVQGTIRCVIDPKSLMFLYGLQLDYSDELIGGGFSFANPNAEETCGCGKSFGV